MKNTSKLLRKTVAAVLAFLMLLEAQALVCAEEGNSASNYGINILLPASVDELYEQKDGMIQFKNDGKYGYLNENFEEVIPAKYEGSFDFQAEGVACVKLGGRYGLIDKAGNVVVPIEYSSIRDFSEERAIVKKEIITEQ